MKRILQCAALIFLTFASIANNSAPLDDKSLQEKFTINFKLASQWIIENGIYAYTTIGTEGIVDKLVDEWAVQLWAVPPLVVVEGRHEIAQFRIKARGINYDIHNLYHEVINGTYYEFWLSKVTAKPWSGESNKSVFYIATTNELFGKRDILLQSDKFISEYQTQSGDIIIFPSDDPELVYFMSPWRYPDNYKGTALENKRAVLGSDGRARFTRWRFLLWNGIGQRSAVLSGTWV